MSRRSVRRNSRVGTGGASALPAMSRNSRADCIAIMTGGSSSGVASFWTGTSRSRMSVSSLCPVTPSTVMSSCTRPGGAGNSARADGPSPPLRAAGEDPFEEQLALRRRRLQRDARGGGGGRVRCRFPGDGDARLAGVHPRYARPDVDERDYAVTGAAEFGACRRAAPSARGASRPTGARRSRRACARLPRGATRSPAPGDSGRRCRAPTCRRPCSPRRARRRRAATLAARSCPCASVPPVSETSLASIAAPTSSSGAAPRADRTRRWARRSGWRSARRCRRRVGRASVERRWLAWRSPSLTKRIADRPGDGAELSRQRAQRREHDLGAAGLDERRRACPAFPLRVACAARRGPCVPRSRRSARRNSSRSEVRRIAVSGSIGLRTSARSPSRRRPSTNCEQRLADARRVAGIDVELVEQDGEAPLLGLARLDGVDLLDDAVYAQLEVFGSQSRDRPALPVGDGRTDPHAAGVSFRQGHGKSRREQDHSTILPEKSESEVGRSRGDGR